MGGKYFIYVRKSTDESNRQVRSVGDQLDELRSLARREGLIVVEELIESRTAKSPGRPIFNAMLKRIKNGDANGILAWHPDRIARNSVDGGQIIWLLDTQILTLLKFSTFWFEPTPQGKLMLSIAFGMSKYYVDKLSEDVKRGLWGKVRSGLWPQRAPVGYLNHASGVLALDSGRAPLVRAAFQSYAKGDVGLTDLQDKINALGLTTVAGRPLSRTQYHRMLRNPVYCGLLRYKSETFEGKHRAIIPTALFNTVQAIVSRKGKPRPELKPFLYRGMFSCGECGKSITTETHKGHHYLRCTKRRNNCSQPYTREELIRAQVTDILRHLIVSASDCDRLTSNLRAIQQHDLYASNGQRNIFSDRLRVLSDQLESLLTLYLSKDISLAEYHAKKDQLMREKQLVNENVMQLDKGLKTWFEPAIRFVSALKLATLLADCGTDAERRDFLKKTGSNLSIQNRRLTCVPHGPWKTIMLQGPFGVCESVAATGRPSFAGEAVPHRSLCAMRDSARTNELLSAIIAFFRENPAWE